MSLLISQLHTPADFHIQEIRVNWAYQSNNTNKEDTSNHSHLFVGDLSNEVSDEILLQAFSVYGNVSEARVMWDMKTGRSRGYGFVAFRDPAESEKALNGMNGEFLGSRAIRVNYANQKGQPSVSQQQAMSSMGMTAYQPQQQAFGGNPMQTVQQVAAQAGPQQTNVYVGNLTPYTSHGDIVQLFAMYGTVLEARLQTDRGFAFVKMDTHENAANVIVQLNGYQINGRPLKCGVSKQSLQQKIMPMLTSILVGQRPQRYRSWSSIRTILASSHSSWLCSSSRILPSIPARWCDGCSRSVTLISLSAL